MVKVENPYFLEHHNAFAHEEILLRGISEEAFLAKQLPPMQPFSIVIKDKNEHVLGGVTGVTLFGALYIDSLWIHSNLRKQGWGSTLILEAEKVGREHGASFVTVQTMDWQALPFYQKLGYTIEFTRNGYAKNSTMYLLRKNF